jgi:hypothetical protein
MKTKPIAQTALPFDLGEARSFAGPTVIPPALDEQDEGRDEIDILS